jgi:protein-S-isoprenylcysteine O-methyltransferase Ste14
MGSVRPRMSQQRTIEVEQDNAGVLIFPPLLLALCAIGGLVSWWLIPVPELPAVASYPLAAVCIAGGLLLDQWAQRTLRLARTAVHPSEQSVAIVRSGPFAWSRNPIYLGQGLLLLAVGLLTRSSAYFWVILPWILVMRFGVIAREERYLLRKFGAPYAEYQRTVRRWL